VTFERPSRKIVSVDLATRQFELLADDVVCLKSQRLSKSTFSRSLAGAPKLVNQPIVKKMSLQHQKAKKVKSKNIAKQLVIKACNQVSLFSVK
jgi:hypothetical protein